MDKKNENPALRDVREQYKNYPYPPRDPEEERTRLIRTTLGPLAVINHHCFGGRQDFQHGFHVLDAGSGTGDSIIHMAEQLRDTDAQLVYLDMSEQSMAIARARAEVRGLENIRYIQGSLLDVPQMGLEPFDLIISTGVLHHLVQPTDGLAALRAVLKDDGVMMLMLYARCGRTGIYQMQELMRMVNGDEEDPARKIANTRTILDALPETNWFRRSQEMFYDWKHAGDAGIYDLFLHSIDRAYSIQELHEFMESSGLHVTDFVPRTRAIFSTGGVRADSLLGDMLARLPDKDRQAAIELVCGTIIKHTFYAAPHWDTTARIDEPDMVPFFFPPNFVKYFRQQVNNTAPNSQLTINGPGGMVATVTVGNYTAAVVKHINGQRTLPEIVREVRRSRQNPRPSKDDVLAEFKRLQAQLGIWDLLLLRHASTPPEWMEMDPGASP